MKLNVFCNVSERRAEATSNGATLTWPPFTAGDAPKISIRFLEKIETSRFERQMALRSGRLTLGVIDATPTAGFFSLKVGNGASTANNTTPQLNYNVSERALEATLNALPDVQALNLETLIRVVFSEGTFEISIPLETLPSLSVVDNTLSPRSFPRIREREKDGRDIYELRLMQAPLAQASIFAREVPPAPSVVTVQEGYTDGSGTIVVPEIQRITIPALFRGSFIIRPSEEAPAKSSILDVDADEDELADALKVMYASQGYIPTVRSEGDGQFLVIYNDKLSLGVDVDEMCVQVFTAPEGDVTFVLDLDTPEVHEALRASAERKDCYLEFEAEVCDDGTNPDDPQTIARTMTLFQSQVVLRRELTWAGLTAATAVDWIRPPEKRDYIPYTPNQILTGQQQAFPAVLGDGLETAFEIDHNFGAEVAYVVVRENVEGGRVLRDDEYTVTITNNNSLTITFPSAPDEDSLYAFVVAMGPESVFQAHTHTIAQIVNLQNLLDDLAGRVTVLEAVLPTVSVGVAAATGGAIEIPIPEITEALFYKGAEKLEVKDGELPTLPRRAPFMLPAAHWDGSITNLPDPLPAPVTGTMWKNNSPDAVLIPGGGGIRSAWVPNEGRIWSDGRVLYPVRKDGTTNSYYPMAFERELFAFFVSEKMLASRTLEVVFKVSLATIGASSRASWVLEIGAGTAPQDTSPATTGPNLQDVIWNATPILRERLVLMQEFAPHTFGTRIKNTLDGMVCDVQNYGLWTGNNAAAPAGPNFALRARLIAFDTENSQPKARGWVFYQLSGAGEGEGGKLKGIIS